MAAAQPIPSHGFDPSESTDKIRSKVHATLARIREKSKTGRLNGDSALFRMKQKLTEFADDTDAAERRQKILDEHDAKAAQKNGSGTHRAVADQG